MADRIIATLLHGKPPVFKVEGHSGPSCEELTRPILERLGVKTANVENTDEYYLPEQAQQQGQTQGH